MTTPQPRPYDVRRLSIATLVALVIAGLVLVVAILPAEYGLDPTGLGRAMGFSKLNEEGPTPAVEEPANDTPSALYELRAAWRLVELPIAERSGYVSRADTEERVIVPIAITNLTSVTATLTWSDTDRINGELTEGDTLEISIRGPGGVQSQLSQDKNAPGEVGTASATLTLRSVPFPEENATKGLTLTTQEDRSGVGNWTFVVRLYSAGGVNGSTERDPGQNWTLTITGEAYEMELEKQTERLGDRVRLTLAPGRGVEYKFEMAANATLTYRWSANGIVHADLHSDLFEDPEDVIEAKIINAENDAGTYTAPRYGRHGWYFRNDGDAALTVTLETTGDYRILGVSS